MYVRLLRPIVALTLTFGIAAAASGQSLSNVPVSIFDPPPSNTLFKPSNALFNAGQIVDRPTADLRPRFHWGLFGSVVPSWSIPGSMGNLFFEDPTSPKMRGRDIRVGIVRGRQLGFELGVSFVRKTVTSLSIHIPDVTNTGFYPSLRYSASHEVTMTGVDSHVVIPITRIGERVQLGILAGGGLAKLPESPFQVQIEGPPFYADANSIVPLSSPPAVGGFVRRYSGGGVPAVPLVPGTRYGIADATLNDISPTDGYWMLLRGQLAADFLLARSLKLRLAAGFNYPGIQAIGIDAVYLFRTGRLAPTRPQPASTEPGAAPGTPGTVPFSAGQTIDQPRVIAPRRSYWGVLGGVTPMWRTPAAWDHIFEDLMLDQPMTMEGRELRVGFTRGRPLGYEFGVSFVRKSWTQFSFVRQGMPVYIGTPVFAPNVITPTPEGARITLTQMDPVQIPGVEFHSFIPIDKIGSRVQLGGLLGAGVAHVPGTAIQKRIEGPPFVASPSSTVGLTTLPANGGFVLDDNSQPIAVSPGQTAAIVTTSATEISPLSSFLILARAQIAADVLIAAPFKLRFSAGFNYPGLQLFGVEAVYLFGRNR